MKIGILAVGKSKTEFLDNAISEYEKRLSRWVAVNWQFAATSTADKESEQLLKFVPEKAHVILLDERGQARSTTEFAHALENLQNQSVKDIIFVIGGAHGVSPAVRARASQIWKLSDMIFPHELVRLILIEQLYRAYDILNNGSYHHI